MQRNHLFLPVRFTITTKLSQSLNFLCKSKKSQRPDLFLKMMTEHKLDKSWDIYCRGKRSSLLTNSDWINHSPAFVFCRTSIFQDRPIVILIHFVPKIYFLDTTMQFSFWLIQEQFSLLHIKSTSHKICVFIYRTYHIMSHGGLQFYWVRAPLAAIISPVLISLTHATHAWNVRWN